MSREIAGIDLNGLWDYVATEGDAMDAQRRERNEGPRSVTVRADRAKDGKTKLVAGLGAISTIFGRGSEFGEKGNLARRRETADAWREIRKVESEEVANESDHLLIKDTGEDEEQKISASDVLLAGVQSAIGCREGARSITRNAGFCIPDDLEMTEVVQARVLEALGRRALGGTKVHLVWDSVSVALAMLERMPALMEKESVGVIVSYGNEIRTHVFRLKKDEKTGRILPVRKGPQDIRPWLTGWNWICETIRMQITPWRDADKVEQQTRAIEHWASGGSEDAWIRNEGGKWIKMVAPGTVDNAQEPTDAAENLEDVNTVIVWSPIGKSVTEALEKSLRKDGREPLNAPPYAGSRGALLAARSIEQGETPWFDHLEGLSLTVIQGKKRRKKQLSLICENEVVRAGEPYRTPADRAKKVSEGLKLEKGKSELMVPLRKGATRYSERIEIETTERDHDVMIVAVQQPATGYARIEITSRTYRPWSEEPKKIVFRPKAKDIMSVVPHLVHYRAAEEAWWENGELTAHATMLKDAANRCRKSGQDAITDQERDYLYKWLCKPRGKPPVNQRYAVGTDGDLPPANESSGWTAEQRVLAERDLNEVMIVGVRTLLRWYRQGFDQDIGIKARNRLHTVPSWTFAKCPGELLDLLLDAVWGIESARRTVEYTHEAAHRAILHGLGRAVVDEERMRRAIRGALDDEDKPFECDALACLSHLLARRRTAGELLNRRTDWIEKLAEIAWKKISEIKDDPIMPDRWKMEAHLQMRYALLLLGGLARVKSMGNIALDDDSEITQEIIKRLDHCKSNGTWEKGKMKTMAKISDEILAIYRGEEADPNLLYRMI